MTSWRSSTAGRNAFGHLLRRRNVRWASSSSSSSPTGSSSGPAPSSKSAGRAVLLGLFGASAYLLGSVYPPSVVTMIWAHPAPPRLGAQTKEGLDHCASIEEQLHSLPLVQKLKSSSSPAAGPKAHEESSILPGTNHSQDQGANPSTAIPSISSDPSATAHYLVSRPYARFPPSKAQHSLTAGSLRGPGLFAVPPLVLSLTPHGAAALGGHEGDAYAFLHLGRSMCGHDGLIHGGLLSTVCDETLARTAFYSLPSHIGVTARLEVDYRAPCKADQFVVVKTEKIESKGRKATVKGEIRDLDGKLLVQARAIFVEPRFASFLDRGLVHEIMDTDGSGAKKVAETVAAGRAA